MTTSKIQRFCRRVCGVSKSKEGRAGCRFYTPCADVKEMKQELAEKLAEKREAKK